MHAQDPQYHQAVPVRNRAARPGTATATPAPVNPERVGPDAAGPGGPSLEDVLALQRSAGNAAAARFVVQARQAEQEAEPAVQRSIVPEVLRSPGRPLDPPMRADMEARLGADFTDVRVHTGGAAARSAEEVGARAYTSGDHVVIGSGGADRHTLAHELTHVIQQRLGPVAGTDRGGGLRVSDPSDPFERAAEAAATTALRGPAPAPGAPPADSTPVDHARHIQAAGRGEHAVQRSSGGGNPQTPGQQPSSRVGRTGQQGVSTPRRRPGGLFTPESPGPARTPRSATPASVQAPPGAVVALTLDQNGLIAGVAIRGRPAHPFPGREGSHTTAWTVYGDTVRRSVVGLPAANAVANMRQLITALGDGAELQEPRRRDNFRAARREAHNALGGALRDGAMQPNAMQQAISQYLTARSLAPLANADFGEAQAVGSGEAGARRELKEHETGARTHTPQELQAAIWSLLDLQTITKMRHLRVGIGHPSTERTFPGRGGRPDAEVAADLVSRHLADIKVAYPIAFNASNLHQPDTIRASLTNTLGTRAQPQAATARRPAQGAADPTLASEVRGALSQLTVGAVPATQPPAAGTYEEDAKVAVQIVLGETPTRSGEPVIRNVGVAGRGDTIHGSGQHHHVTAHVAVVVGLQRTLMGRSLREGLAAMRQLTRDLKSLPTYPEPAVWPQNAQTVDPTGVLQSALQSLDSAEQAAGSAADDPNKAQVALQRLAAAYLAARNALPLVSATVGAPATGKAEANTVQQLDKLENSSSRIAPATAQQLLAGLLDANALDAMASDDESTPLVSSFAPSATAPVPEPSTAPVPEPSTAPVPEPSTALTGTGRPRRQATRRPAPEQTHPDRINRIVAALHVFVHTVSTAWPRIAAAARLKNADGLRQLLRATDLDLVEADLNEIIERYAAALALGDWMAVSASLPEVFH